ncbi:hypothetical protein [[Limnothrix rosea] IAM M-220]|uniref:hypothetical protein n=1 Tax=[Limnothrix rosea] IAM M-220 TaxID=454133 RepID=UPI00095DE17C|nr:hypothetical protein [[Limnothrix rosea] IAM M-220]OKH16866.1 hypothetical protein NIES208_11760 [[Limnothrix rosea] IAM M-220]
MYPVIYGYQEATKKVEKLIEDEYYPEALVVSMFIVEKTLRRTLKQLIVSAGFTSKYANIILRGLKGFASIKKAWELYDPAHAKLSNIIQPTDLKLFQDVATQRNKLIHGERTYDELVCRQQAENIMRALGRVKVTFDTRYGYSGWSKPSIRRKSTLHSDPKVRVDY